MARWNLHGTKIVKNGDPSADDVRWGIVFRCVAWGGGIVSTLIVAALFWFTARVNTAVELVPIIYERQGVVLHRLEKIETRIAEEGEVMTRTQFLEWINSEFRRDNVRAIAEEKR